MTCTTKLNFKQTVRKQAYTRYSIENQLVYLEKKAKYGLEPELLTQLAIRQLSNIRTLGHYTTVFAHDPTIQESNRLHLTEGRKRLVATTTPQVFKCSYLYFTLKWVLETN